MNCWGGGFQKNWMVVEFTASTCTFWGGAVGTAPRHQRGNRTNRAEREWGEKREKWTQNPLSVTRKSQSNNNLERGMHFPWNSSHLESWVIGLISHPVWEIPSRGGKEMVPAAYYPAEEFLRKTWGRSHKRIGEHSSFRHPWVHRQWRVSERNFLSPLMLLNSPDQTRKHRARTIKVLIVNYNLATASVYYLLLLKELGAVISHAVKIFLGNWELFSFYLDIICIHVYWIDYIYPEPIHALIY